MPVLTLLKKQKTSFNAMRPASAPLRLYVPWEVGRPQEPFEKVQEDF